MKEHSVLVFVLSRLHLLVEVPACWCCGDGSDCSLWKLSSCMERTVLVLEKKLLLCCSVLLCRLTTCLSAPICSSWSDGSFNCFWKTSASLNFLPFSLQCIFSFPFMSVSFTSVVRFLWFLLAISGHLKPSLQWQRCTNGVISNHL